MMIDGMRYIPNFITTEEHSVLMAKIDSESWSTELKRRVQHYGYRYDYKERAVTPSMYLGSLPDFVSPIVDRMMERELFKDRPDQLIINEYEPGQGISAHIDCEPCFGDIIASVSLGWAYEMDFLDVETKECHSYLLGVGSVLTITGAARYKWFHRIRSRKKDGDVPRQRRVSLTFRNVII